MISSLLALSMPGTTEWVVIGLIALLFFGRKLPDVARSLGQSIIEFKKGLKDVKQDIDVPPRIEPPRAGWAERRGQDAPSRVEPPQQAKIEHKEVSE